MKEYKLRYDRREDDYLYAERDFSNKRNISKKPVDEFGKELEEKIRELAEKHPELSMTLEVRTWYNSQNHIHKFHVDLRDEVNHPSNNEVRNQRLRVE